MNLHSRTFYKWKITRKPPTPNPYQDSLMCKTLIWLFICVFSEVGYDYEHRLFEFGKTPLPIWEPHFCVLFDSDQRFTHYRSEKVRTDCLLIFSWLFKKNHSCYGSFVYSLTLFHLNYVSNLKVSYNAPIFGPLTVFMYI